MRERVVRRCAACHDERHAECAAPGFVDGLIVAPRGFGDAVELGHVAFKPQPPHTERSHDGHRQDCEEQPGPCAGLPCLEPLHQPRQPQRRLAGLFRHRYDQRQNHECECSRKHDADRAENPKLLVAVHRGAGHDQERGDGRERADADGEHEPPKMFADGNAVATRGAVEVVDDVDRVVHRDADGDAREAGRNRGEVTPANREDHTREQRAKKRREKCEDGQPAPAENRQAEHQHGRHANGDATQGVGLDDGGVVHRHPVSARDGDVNAGEFFLHVPHGLHQLLHERCARPGICGRQFWFGHHQDVPPVAARDAAIHDLRVAKTGLQRQHLRHHERAHADGICGDDILEHHAFRPAQLAAHHGEEVAHGSGFEFGRKQFGVRFSEQIRQRAGEEITHLLLTADLNTVHDAPVSRVRGEFGKNFVGSEPEPVRVVGVDADVQIHAVNLAKFAERVAVLVHGRIALRQHGEDVLVQIHPQRDDDAHE